MATPAEPSASLSDADSRPLLREQGSPQPAPAPQEAEEQPQSSGGGPAEPQSAGGWGWLKGWLAGRRRERLPTTDEEDEEAARELQERGAGPPSIAVVVESADGAADPSGGAAAGGSEASGSSRDAEIQPRQSGSPRMARMASRGPPTCLICLEEFTQEEFVNGSALRLECNCRGDLALRHRDCVMKWVQVKGSNVCELCKAEIRNIPAPPPRPTEADLPQLDEAYFSDPSHIHDFMPSSQDLVFDCIRVCWVAMIVSILFFEMSLGAALWTGMLAGLAYSIMVRLMYRQHFYAMRRLAEQQAALRREAEGGGAPTQQQQQAAPGGGPPVVVAV